MKRTKQREVSQTEKDVTEFFFRILELARNSDPDRYSQYIPTVTDVYKKNGVPRLWWLKGISSLYLFFKLLKKYDLIEADLAYDSFCTHFLDTGSVAEPIKWRGQLNQLAILINSLLSLEKKGRFRDGHIKYVDEINVVVCSHFLVFDKMGNPITSDKMKSARGNGSLGEAAAKTIVSLMNELNEKIEIKD